MIISDLALKSRVSVLVLAVIIIIVGIYSYITLPREDNPEVKIPYVFVSTSYRGVSPDDIEASITVKIEEKLKGLKNVKKISSSSREGASLIAVEFVTGTEIERALQWVKDKVDMAKRDLPGDLEDDPAVFEVNISELPIITVAVKAPMGLRELRDYAQLLKEDIETIQGVLGVDMYGGLERQIFIEVDPDKLTLYNIPFELLYGVVYSENQNISGGNISMGDGRYQLRVPGEFSNLEEFQNIIVTMSNDTPIYLRDIAVIKDGHQDADSKSRLNFENSINLDIKKRSGENIIKVADEVKALLEERKKTFPRGLEARIVSDMSQNIRFMLNDLENNIITAFLLVLLVLMCAMGFRNALLASISIPLSMFLSFALLNFLGYTLNMIVLFSVILSLGMLVDNAIVIVENIFRFVSQGVGKRRAAQKATSEVAWPVIASTVTTVAAFSPLLFWTGIMGDFMKYLPITLITTLSSALFVAMVINPVLCSYFMKENKESVKNSEIDSKIMEEKPLETNNKIMLFYERVLRKALKNRISIIVSSFLVLFLMMTGWFYRTGFERPVEFFPEVDPDMFFVNIDPPEGMDLDSVEKIAVEIERRIQNFSNIPEKFRDEAGKPLAMTEEQLEKFNELRKIEGIDDEIFPSDIKDIRFIYTNLTSNMETNIFSEGNLPNHIGIQFHKYELRNESSKRTLERIRARLKGIPGAHITISEFTGGPPTGAPINIEISGNNFSILGMISDKVMEVVREIPYVSDVESNFSKGIPTIELKVDRQKAALFGISTAVIGNTVKTAINGWNISSYRENNKDYDVFVRVGEDYRKNIDILKKLFITSPGGAVPLSDISEIVYKGGFGSISRINHQRVVTVKAQVDAEKMPGAVARGIAEKMLKNVQLPTGYNITFTGENQEQEESEEFLSKAFLIALFLVFMVLVTQFNSIGDTLIIMVSVILSLGGVFLGLWVSDMPFGIIMTGIGVISLAGVVVNNAIVLLDYTIKLMERGYSLTEAVVNGAKTRFRPVILTAVTTILGLIPMITGVSIDFKKFEIITDSQSAQFWYSMAIAVAFGLAVATVLTLVVVPVIFHLVTSIKMRFSEIFEKLTKKEEDIIRGAKVES